MASPSYELLPRVLGQMADYVVGKAWWVLCCAAVVASMCWVYAFANLGINTDTTEMLSADLPFRQAQEQYQQLFPQNTNSIVIVVEANTPEMAHAAVKTLNGRLRDETEHIKSVYTPFGGAFFETHSLLFLDLPELEQLAESVAESKPFIDQLIRDLSLSGLFMMLSDSYDQTGWVNESLADAFFLRMAEAIQSTLAGLDYILAWHSVILKQDLKTSQTLRFLLVQPHLDYQKWLPAGEALQRIHQVIDDSQLLGIPGVRIRVTGEVALAHEELQVVSRRAGIAALLALLMVSGTLLIAFRSWRLMFATLVTLLVGLALSAAFATMAVGQLNIISLAFAVLFVGLAVDYAIHLSLRYQELLGLESEPDQAIRKSIQEVGPALMLCAVTTGLGFYSFVPTNYAGMSELGLISGTSMFIGLVVSLTVLPAIFKVLPLPQKERGNLPSAHGLNPIYQFPIRHGGAIRWGTLFLIVGSLFLLPQASFDRNPHNLRDPHVESVQTLDHLLEDGTGVPWTLTYVTSNDDGVIPQIAQLEELESVDRVVTLQNFVPTQQIGKFFLLEELAEWFLPESANLGFGKSPKEPDAFRPTLELLLSKLEQHIGHGKPMQDSSPAIRLRDQIRNLLTHLDSMDKESQQGFVDRLKTSLLGSVPTGPIDIAEAKKKGPVTQDDLPQELSERWVTEEGSYRMEVYPKKDLRDTVALEQFVNEVRSIAPQVTGLPVIYLEGGNEVAWAFRQAFVTALMVILIILLIVFRNVWDTLLVILPLCLAAFLLVAYTVIFDMPFNYANTIALPLLFGLGADSGIHIVERMRRRPTQCEAFLRSSTIRGVFFSSLTTILSFSNLAYTSHIGVSSMGQLLTLGVLLTLIGCLVVLPAFLYRSPLWPAKTAM